MGMDELGMQKTLSLAILAGGLSSRMTCEKANLRINIDGVEKTFLHHLCERFLEEAHFTEYFISTSKTKDWDIPGFEMVRDLENTIGPMGGIQAVLRRSKNDAVFFLPCDMPFFSHRALEVILEKWDGSPICMATLDGRREPLAGIYCKRALPVIDELIAQGQYKLGMLLPKVPFQLVEMGQYRECFANVNTPEEYQRILQEGQSFLASS